MCSEPFIFSVFPFSDVLLKKFYMRTLEWNDELKKYFFIFVVVYPVKKGLLLVIAISWKILVRKFSERFHTSSDFVLI